MNLGPVRALESAIAAVDRDELPQVIGELARLEALARLRLSENGRAGETPAHPKTRSLDRYLGAGEVADRLGMSTDWVYRHADELGAVKLGGAVRFPERAVARYFKNLR